MSRFMVKMTAVNTNDESRSTPPIEVLVNTGSEVSWLLSLINMY